MTETTTITYVIDHFVAQPRGPGFYFSLNGHCATEELYGPYDTKELAEQAIKELLAQSVADILKSALFGE